MIFGTGAMACYFGARLSRVDDVTVTLVGSWPEGVAGVATDGVRVEDRDGTWSARGVRAVSMPAVPATDVALVLVKSHQTGAVAPHVARAIGHTGIALTLQNGLGNREAIAGCVPIERVLVGVTTAGATLLGPGHVRGYPAPVFLGRDPAGHAERLAPVFSAAGLAAEVRDDVDAIVWKKLAVNCALNPLSALLGTTNGALVETPGNRQVVEAVAREVEAVAAALGVAIPEDYAEAALEAARLTAGNRSSMLQDVSRGAPTEIEALNGAVVREGTRLGVPVPENEKLLYQIRALEAPRRRAASLPA